MAAKVGSSGGFSQRMHIAHRRPHSAKQKVVQGKCPLHFLHFNGVVCSNTLFSNTSVLTNSLSVIQGKFYMKDSRTPRFCRTLLGSNFGGLLLEQTFCRHFAAFPCSHIRISKTDHISQKRVYPYPTGPEDPKKIRDVERDRKFRARLNFCDRWALWDRLGAGSARPNPKLGAPDPENPLFLGFSVLRGGLRPWSQTMVSEGARPWGGGRSGDCESYESVRVPQKGV